MTLHPLRLAAGAVLFGSAVTLSGCLGGPTYGTGKTQGEQLVSDLDGMLAFGSTNKETISYQPRAELVRPADISRLPAPQAKIDAANNPNWPESPEIRSARIKAAADARDDGDGAVSADVALADKEGITDAQIAANSSGRAPESQAGRRLTPDEMKGGTEAFRERLKENRQGSPVQRKYLSEPPLEYRQPASTAPVDDPGVDEDVKEAKYKKNEGLGSKLKGLLPF